MALRSALASSGSSASEADRDAEIVADGVSKQYPGRPVTIFPPVLSIFEREYNLNPFRRRRESPEDKERRQEEQRKRAGAGDRIDMDEQDDDLDDEDELEELERDLPPPRAAPDEMFWALKDVSFRVPRGASLGILGEPGAGKSTLLRILGGWAVPTEGRALVRGQVSPLATEVPRALALSGKKGDDITLAVRLLGVHGHQIKRYRDEIEALAQPLLDEHGDPVPGARIRLGVATVAVLPANVILLEEPRGMDPIFMERVVEQLRVRLRRGSTLVFASRSPDFVRALCDETISLHEGQVIDRGPGKDAAARYEAGQDGGNGHTPPVPALALGHHLARGGALRIPSVVTAFHASAALLSADVRARSKRVDADEELSVEIGLETAWANVEVHCSVSFTPRTGDGPGVRIELPEPHTFSDPRTYLLTARVPPGTLPDGAYEVRAEAIVASAQEAGPSVIARDAGRIRIVAGELAAPEPAEEPVTHWDGRASWRAEGDWSIE